MTSQPTSNRPDQAQEQRLLLAALALGSEAERQAFIAAITDPDTRHRLQGLIAASAEADSFFRNPPLPGTSMDPAAPTVSGAPVFQGSAPMIGRYKLLEKIGEGGFGEVWMAEQREPVKRRVALKILKPGMDSRQIVARFEAERQALALMDHPHIARIFDAGTTEAGRPYFVMELVRGTKITEYCDHHQLTTAQRLDLFILVCNAIQHAHQKGIIHRDIKPSNVLVTVNDGAPVPKVIDFGIAKATQAELTDKTVFTQFQQFIGTPAYISPEQAEMSSLDIDTRADIYSLGVLLYELLVGQTPFDAREMMKDGLDALRKIIREQEPQRPSTRLNTLPGDARTTAGKRRQTDAGRLVHQLQGDLDWIVMKCLEKDRTRRYETANGLAVDLQRHLANEPVVARPPSAAYRFQKAFRRNKLVFLAGAAVGTALVLGCGLATFAILQKQAALQELVHSDHQRVVERVRYAIQSGDEARTELALRAAEESQLPEAHLRFLRGLHLVTTAQADRAIAELRIARTLQPGHVAALGLQATATMAASGPEEFEAMIPALEAAKPVTPDDRLFLGQAIALIKPRVGLLLMEEAVRGEDSPMARILLAGARTVVATDSGDLSLLSEALADIAAAEAWTRHSLPVVMASCHAHQVAAELYLRAGKDELAARESQAAEKAGVRLESFHPNPQALRARLDHLILTGAVDQALESAGRWSREIPGANLHLHLVYVLLMKGDYKVALDLARPLKRDPLMRWTHFLAAMETGDLSEANAVLEEMSASTPGSLQSLFATVSINLLAGRQDRAQAMAGDFLRRRGVIGGLLTPQGVGLVIRFLAGTLDEDTLLKDAKGSHHRADALHFAGMHHLAMGDRKKARLRLQESVEVAVGGGISKHISLILLKHMDENPHWPPAIPARDLPPAP